VWSLLGTIGALLVFEIGLFPLVRAGVLPGAALDRRQQRIMWVTIACTATVFLIAGIWYVST